MNRSKIGLAASFHLSCASVSSLFVQWFSPGLSTLNPNSAARPSPSMRPKHAERSEAERPEMTWTEFEESEAIDSRQCRAAAGGSSERPTKSWNSFRCSRTFSCCIKVPSSPSTMSLLDACQYARARASGDSAGRGCPAIVSAPKSQRPRVSRDGALPEVRVARVRRMSCTATLSHEEVVCDETNLWSLERRAARSVGDMERAESSCSTTCSRLKGLIRTQPFRT
mmetsp:Transcript_14006/g.42730  ORF Transcript_14006/g.42730 Transcript_14006/m.42730 type:complete len:225 (-) Transcript_14006:1946-2620(-)